ncbi:hypothetical protein SVIOM342S_02391 [Streptomyces violaceorubidus]
MTLRGHRATSVLRLRHAAPGGRNHDALLRGRVRAEEPARLHGAVLYEGPGYPYAVEAGEGTVRGEIVTARPAEYDALLAELDRLEEYAPGDPRNLYDRVARTVVEDGDGAVRPGLGVRRRARGRRPAPGARPPRRGRGLGGALTAATAPPSPPAPRTP